MSCDFYSDHDRPWLRPLRWAGIRVLTRDSAPDAAAGEPLAVRWGSLIGNDRPYRQVINRQAALRQAASPDALRQRLTVNGLPPMTRREAASSSGARLYRAEVFDLQPLTVQRLVESGGRWRVRNARDVPRRTLLRAASAAVRALHAVGLDAGRVDVVVLPPRDGMLREGVCGLDAAPRWPSLLAERLAAAIAMVEQEDADRATTPQPLLGADPEFILVDAFTGAPLSASAYFPRRGSVGCDAQTMPDDRTQRPIAEVRPVPRRDPERLVAEIRRCLKRAVQRLPGRDIELRAGSLPVDPWGLGGHVHLSDIRLSGRLLRALDTYLAVPVLCVEEPPRAAARRKRHGYLGDVRFKDHGGFEYRTLPSWLVAPWLASAVLHLTLLVVREHRSLRRDLFLDADLHAAFYRGDREAFYPHVSALFGDLVGTETYEQVRTALDPLLDLIDRRQTWPVDRDLRHVWRLEAPARSRQRSAAAIGATPE